MKTAIFSMTTLLWLFSGIEATTGQDQNMETLNQLTTRLSAETERAYAQSPFSALSKNYFSRFTRNPDAQPQKTEIAIDADWKIMLPQAASTLARRMADDFAEFMHTRMGVPLPIKDESQADMQQPGAHQIILREHGGGEAGFHESFTLDVTKNQIQVSGCDPSGLRDGIVALVDRIGFRGAPYLAPGRRTFKPRLKVRLGAVPKLGSYRDAIFLGYNAVFAGGGSLYALSTSEALPELISRRSAGSLENGQQAAREARRYGLKTYAFLDTRQKFPKADPVFLAHPDVRGALTWKADGEYVLCTEHPLVQRYLCESVRGIFEADPELNGIVLIIGGEGFYHCFMRPYGVKKGHTNCPRCEALGAEQVVANLCNRLAAAIREVNPDAEVVAWPYSAEHVWSADKAQAGFIARLKPGVAIFTEIEKDEYVQKPDGVNKHLWDYSIDLIGPGLRAEQQIAACKAAGIPIYMKSEPELAFEAPRLPHIPCLQRWAERAEALASCGADGAWVFPAFRPNFGSSAAEIYKFFWWTPTPDPKALLQDLAVRIAGEGAAPHLKKAWELVSAAIPWSPELPSYYTGPYYLGPAHPICADPDASLPPVFYGRYLFHAEIMDAEGLKLEPTFVKSPTGDAPVFERFYRKMEADLQHAVAEMDSARSLVPARCQLMFDAEESPIRWFYHTARTEANFYESCRLRERLLAIADQVQKSAADIAVAREFYARWLEVLQDERANAAAALPVMQADMRLDFYYGSDHTFSHGAEMLRAKLELLEHEINDFLPELAERIGVK